MGQAAQPSPVVCNLAAFTPEQRQRHSQLSKSLKQATVEIRELPDG
jgi:hypothetical protein